MTEIDNDKGLFHAARFGRIGLIELFLRKGAKPEYGLKGAAAANNQGLIDFFIKRGADRSSIVKASKLAAKAGHIELVKYLIHMMNATDGSQHLYEIMCYASRGGHLDIVIMIWNTWPQFIIRPYIWNRPLVEAAKGGHRHLVNFFLEQGADNYYGATEQAGRGGHLELFKFLQTKSGLNGGYPLIMSQSMNKAAKHGRIEIVKYCIEQGATTFDIQNAAKSGNQQIVDLFIENGAKDWNRGLVSAVCYGHKHLVNFFIRQGADADAWTQAMKCACYNGHLELVKMFAGRVRQSRDIFDQFIRHAKHHKRNHVIEYLKTYRDRLPSVFLFGFRAPK
jgi:ankyrin repeat protein